MPMTNGILVSASAAAATDASLTGGLGETGAICYKFQLFVIWPFLIIQISQGPGGFCTPLCYSETGHISCS